MIERTFWQERYETQNTPWDLASPSPHFEKLIEGCLKPGTMAVLGCGRGHDAALFAQQGFDVVGFDYASGAIQEASNLYGNQVRFVQADIFDLANPQSEWAQAFDYVLEHTCFCAIHPVNRPAYVQSARNLLKPGGYLLGVFWEHEDSDGPPFSTPVMALEQAFGADFTVESITDCAPVAGRSGIERLVILRRKQEL